MDSGRSPARANRLRGGTSARHPRESMSTLWIISPRLLISLINRLFSSFGGAARCGYSLSLQLSLIQNLSICYFGSPGRSRFNYSRRYRCEAEAINRAAKNWHEPARGMKAVFHRVWKKLGEKCFPARLRFAGASPCFFLFFVSPECERWQKRRRGDTLRFRMFSGYIDMWVLRE